MGKGILWIYCFVPVCWYCAVVNNRSFFNVENYNCTFSFSVNFSFVRASKLASTCLMPIFLQFPYCWGYIFNWGNIFNWSLYVNLTNYIDSKSLTEMKQTGLSEMVLDIRFRQYRWVQIVNELFLQISGWFSGWHLFTVLRATCASAARHETYGWRGKVDGRHIDFKYVNFIL